MLTTLESSEIVEHKQLGRLVNSFIFDLDKTSKKLELKLISVLRMLGIVRSSINVTFAAPVAVALVGNPRPTECVIGGLK